MKKNLAMLLALVMLIGALFSVIPTAAAEASSSAKASAIKTPEIAYANVNYTDNIYMMFAVPAITGLGDASVELIIWESRLDTIAFSYSDLFKKVLVPEAELVSIKGVKHYVFKYDALDATQMTNVICARPVIVENGNAIAYGKVIDYSIREYVESAKGNIEGIDGISNTEHLSALDDMLAFGALAQDFAELDLPYYANDELKSIYVNLNVNGFDRGKVFAGFFKYEPDEAFAFTAPFIDGNNVVKITDSAGNTLTDIDDFTDGFQILGVDSDVTLNVYYENAAVRTVLADPYGIGMSVNNYDAIPSGGNGLVTKNASDTIYFQQASANFSGDACKLDSSSRMNYWNAIKTVADPSNPENAVFQFTATNTPAFYFNTVTSADFLGIGFGDTIYPAFTFEVSLGAVNGKMPTTDYLYFRYRHSLNNVGYVDLQIFKIDNGVVRLRNGAAVGELAKDGTMRKFAITIDALTGEIYGYAENANGVMEHTAKATAYLSNEHRARQQQHFANLADNDPSNDETLIVYESIYTFFTKAAKLEPTWVFGNGSKTNANFEASSIEINGVMTPVKNADGSFNMEAVQALAERDYSFLLDDFKFIMGAIYE